MTERVFAAPGDGYLELIGALAYGVASLEWTVLGDLPLLQERLPAALSLERLAGKGTGQLAFALVEHADRIADDAVRGFVRVAAEALSAAALLRNDVLHARPTTIDSQQQLYRWSTRPGQQFVITSAHLEHAIAEVGRLARTVDATRVRPRR